jgi:pilus assembly protein CpaF
VTRDGRAALFAAVRRSVDGSAAAEEVAVSVRAGLPLGGSSGVLSATRGAARHLFGAGPLEPLLALPDVSDVLVNGPGPVWLDRGQGVEDSGVRIDDERELRALAHRLVAAAGRRLDDASPFADARLADGTRVHAVLPPVAPQGTTISLRVPPRRAFALDELVAAGSIGAAGATLLRRLVAARVAFVVTGGTGTGKTTVLSTLLSEADRRSRLVLVEDAAELRPRHPHVVRLEARPANAEGAGGVDLADLVRQALRMRPDRLVVGEVRGAEVVDLLAALNTGHEGGCATVHANRAQDVPARFEALGAAAGLSRATIHAQLSAGVRAVVHLRRRDGGARLIDSVGVVTADAAGTARVDVAAWLHPDRVEPGPAAAAFEALLAPL